MRNNNAAYIADRRIVFDLAEKEVTADNLVIPRLTPQVFKAFGYMAIQPDCVLSHEELCIKGWGSFDSKTYQNLKSGVKRFRLLVGEINQELADVKTGALRNKRRAGYLFVSRLAGEPRP